MSKEEVISIVIDSAYEVHRELHPGFLESVYKSALVCELQNRGIASTTEQLINVYYKGKKVGVFYADIVVDGWLIVELKAINTLSVEHELQLVNYLNATNTETGLLINFGSPKIQIKRKYKDYK